jgi:two-component system cell cycle response regulator DivK
MTTLLIVEDNPSNMKLLAGILTRSGYEVLQAIDADVGVPLAREKQPALIFMDIHMPGTDGVTATRLLKADPLTAGIPVIAVTAHAMQGDRENILAAGCDEYIAKPIRYKEVLAAVERILQGKN